jgi:hypothetical protein
MEFSSTAPRTMKSSLDIVFLCRESYPWREAVHPLLQHTLESFDGDSITHRAVFHNEMMRLYSQCTVSGRLTFPQSGYIEMALAAACRKFNGNNLQINLGLVGVTFGVRFYPVEGDVLICDMTKSGAVKFSASPRNENIPWQIKSIYFGLCCSLILSIVAVFRLSWLRYLGLAGSLCWKPFRCRLGLFGIFFVCQSPDYRRPGYFRFRLCSIWMLSICPMFLMTGLVCASIRLNCRQLYRLLVRNSIRFCNWYCSRTLGSVGSVETLN